MSTLSLAGVLTYLRRLGPREADRAEAELLARFAAGDGAALEALVRLHAGLVWGVCRRMLANHADAEDAFQATFLVLARKAKSLADGRPLAPWLHAVATRTAAKARALAARRAGREAAAVEPAVTMPDEAALREARAVVDEEVGRLPAKYREAVMLCYLEGRTNEEAAKQLGCPKGTILSRLSRARDWLRRRLERRGLAPGVMGLGELFAPADVPMAAAAGAGRAGAASGGALALAEGVVMSMFVQQLKWVGVACLVLALGAAGAGWLAGARGNEDKTGPEGRGSAAGVKPEKQAEAKKDEAPVAAAQKGKEEGPPPAPKEALLATVSFPGVDDPKVTLLEVLDQLSKLYRVTFDFNERAFRREMLNDVGKAEVASTPLAPMKTSLATVLRKVLSRVNSPSGAAFIIRKDRIEITTNAAIRDEVGLPPVKGGEEHAEIILVNRRLLQSPFEQALADIAEETGENIVLDPRAKKQATTELTLRLTNVPIDTALRLLADMASLEVVRIDNVYYVTTPENAEKLRKKLAAEAGASRHSTKPPAGGGA